MTVSIESEFAGKRALVTGGTRGIGEAIVERLRGAGAKVITTSRSAPQGLRQPELFVEADVSTAEGVEKVVGMTLKDMCTTKLRRDFPDREFVISFPEEFDLDVDDPEITFYTKRDPVYHCSGPDRWLAFARRGRSPRALDVVRETGPKARNQGG